MQDGDWLLSIEVQAGLRTLELHGEQQEPFAHPQLTALPLLHLDAVHGQSQHARDLLTHRPNS